MSGLIETKSMGLREACGAFKIASNDIKLDLGVRISNHLGLFVVVLYQFLTVYDGIYSQFMRKNIPGSALIY